MNTIESSVIGVLQQNEQFDDWWKSQPVEVPLISKEVAIRFMGYAPSEDSEFISEADQALTNFLALEPTYKFEIAKHVLENFEDFKGYVSDDDIPEKMKNVNVMNILNFVYPTEAFVSRRARRDKDVYILLACECEWEQEHGLQLVFRQGKKLTRVSDQDGHLTEADAFDIADSEDKMLSAY